MLINALKPLASEHVYLLQSNRSKDHLDAELLFSHFISCKAYKMILLILFFRCKKAYYSFIGKLILVSVSHLSQRGRKNGKTNETISAQT